MTIVQSIFLGIIQGITEFFPISSSAHLISFRYLFNFAGNLTTTEWLFVDVALHFGTLMAIAIYFFWDFIAMFRDGFKFRDKDGKMKFSNLTKEGKILWYIVAACIPAAVAGILLEDIIDSLVRDSVVIISITLTVMGIFLYIIDKKAKSEINIEQITLKQAVLIGFGQMLAIIPGFSRSGTTMTVARAMKLDRESAAKFSFLLGAPAMLGAAIFSLKHFDISMLNVQFFIGVFVSFIVGIIAIKTLMNIVKKMGFGVFAIYRFMLALVLIVTMILR